MNFSSIIVVILICVVIVGICIYLAMTSTVTGGNDDREIEWRFVFEDDTHIDQVKNKLQKMGAKKRSEGILPIMVYNPPGDTDAYVRVRGTPHGDLEYTVKTDRQSEFPKEYEVTMENTPQNVDQMDKILKATGHTLKYRVEKVREFWDAPGIKEIVFDSLPAVPTYIEIDAETLADLKRVTKNLGFNPKDRIILQDFYNYWYGIPTDRKILPGALLTFDDVSQFDGQITKNQELFDTTLAKQRDYIKKFR